LFVAATPRQTNTQKIQVRSVSVNRFVRRLGRVSRADLDAILAALGLIVEYPLRE